MNLHEGVETIGDLAFQECKSLSTITIPKTVREIGDYTFVRCTSLRSISIPPSIKTIGLLAFYDCSKLESVSIAEGIEKIGSGAFYDCKKLTTVNIPGSVRKIQRLTFFGCENLQFVSIGDGVEEIEDNAFQNCRSITSIALPKSIKKIYDDAFPNLNSATCEGGEMLAQLIVNKCLTDAFKIREQYESMQVHVLKMIDILHNNQMVDARCLPFYKDITNYYTLTGEFEKVMKYCEEALSHDFSDIDFSIEKQYWNTKHYYALQLADVCISLNKYDDAKNALRQFETDYFKSDSSKIGTADAVSSIIKKDTDLGTYYYYLILKLYCKLLDVDNLLKYSKSTILQNATRKSSLYVNNALIYWLKIKVGLFNYLKKTEFEKYKQELISDLAKYGMYNSGFNEIYTVIGDCHYHYKETDSAFAYYSKSFEYELDRLKANFSFMNTFQRQNYWDEHRFSFDNITKISTKMPGNKDAVEMAYNALLVSKGLILASEQNLTNTIQNSKDEKLKNDFFALKRY
ncbi:MAG: leucine-rich repeat protein, partial [Bacteroidales bacterium]|nr:leucine-rich repeat protein [Bacteroidales bacterium]